MKRQKQDGTKEILDGKRREVEEEQRFLKRASEQALPYFRQETEMTKEGFELCVHEMLRYDCNRLYAAFCDKYRVFESELEKRADELMEKSMNSGLTERNRRRIWNGIRKKISEKKKRAGNED